ncbi:hypothetical protein V8B97DRAFT_2026289 [Scleroderma yunnanense]
MSASGAITCHSEYYFDNSMYIFQVEDKLYKLFHSILANKSPIFTDLFALPPGQESVEGKVDEVPIVIDPELTAEVFDLFVELKFVCPCSTANYSEKNLREFLKFIDKYECSDHVCSFITSCIIEKELFKRGFTWLCDLPLTKIQKSHHVQMGLDIYAAFVYVKAHLDKYTHTWNGMGGLLLNAKNPQPFDNALDCFKHLQFGHVGEDCKRHMFSKVMLVNVPLAHSHHFVTSIRDHLVQKLILV